MKSLKFEALKTKVKVLPASHQTQIKAGSEDNVPIVTFDDADKNP